MIYSAVYSQIWKDKKIRNLSLEGKICFIYTFTNSDTTPSGIYNFDVDVAKVEIGLSNSKFEKAFKELIKNGLIKWDEERNIIWVVNKFKYTPKSSTVIKGIVKDLLRLKHPFCEEFFEKYHDYVASYLPPEVRGKK